MTTTRKPYDNSMLNTLLSQEAGQDGAVAGLRSSQRMPL